MRAAQGGNGTAPVRRYVSLFQNVVDCTLYTDEYAVGRPLGSLSVSALGCVSRARSAFEKSDTVSNSESLPGKLHTRCGTWLSASLAGLFP